MILELIVLFFFQKTFDAYMYCFCICFSKLEWNLMVCVFQLVLLRKAEFDFSIHMTSLSTEKANFEVY